MNRTLLFLVGCIGLRLALAYFAKIASPAHLKLMAVGAGLISIGFATIYAFGLRKTGIETGGELIWWNELRPLHAVLFATFAFMAWNGDQNAWKVLMADTLVGLSAWTFIKA